MKPSFVFACSFPLLAVACAASQDDATAFTTSEAIYAGTPVSPEQSGFVTLSSPLGRCSGALIDNQWVLTARHCFYTTDTGPATFAASQYAIAMGSQSTVLDRLYLEFDPGLDVGLGHLAKPFVMNGSTTGFGRQLETLPLSSLTGTKITCYGYGLDPTNANAFGTLRTSSLAVVGGGSFTFDAKSLAGAASDDGLMWFGDSGGSCLDVYGKIAGVQSNLFNQPGDNYDELVRADQITGWAENVMLWGIAGPDLPGCEAAQQCGSGGVELFCEGASSGDLLLQKNDVTFDTISVASTTLVADYWVTDHTVSGPPVKYRFCTADGKGGLLCSAETTITFPAPACSVDGPHHCPAGMHWCGDDGCVKNGTLCW